MGDRASWANVDFLLRMAPDGNRERFNRNMLPGGSDFWKLGVGGSCFLYYQLKFKLPELLPLPPQKSEREKGPNPPLSSPSPGRASNPHFLRKRTLPQHSAAHLSVFSVLSLVGDPSLEMPKKLQREIYLGGRCCRGSPKQSEDFNELNSKRNTEEGPFGYWKRHPPAEGERGLVDKRPEKKRFGWLESGPPPHFLYPLSIAVYCRTKMPERGKLVKYPGGRWMYSWLWDTCAFKIETGEPFPASAFAWKEEKQPEKMGSEKIEHSSGVSMWTFPVLTHLTQFRLT